MILHVSSLDERDAAWSQAKALMKMLPIDPRRTSMVAYPKDSHGRYLCGLFVIDATEYLHRPQQRLPSGESRAADVYVFEVRLGAGISVSGTIPVNDQNRIACFCAAVQDALDSELTTHERTRWLRLNAAGRLRKDAQPAQRELALNEAQASWERARFLCHLVLERQGMRVSSEEIIPARGIQALIRAGTSLLNRQRLAAASLPRAFTVINTEQNQVLGAIHKFSDSARMRMSA